MDMQPPFPRQTGVTLIESLVAVVVISIGLLGIAGLHLAGLRDTAEAEYYSRAISLGNELVERIRANRSAAALNAYSTFGANPASAASQGCRTATGNCSPDGLAQDDVAEWYAMLLSPSVGLPPPAAADPPVSRTTITLNDPNADGVWDVSVRIDWSIRQQNYNYLVQTRI